MHNRQMKKVLALLDNENAIIRRGDLQELPNLARQKALLMDDIATMRLSANELNDLQTAAMRNARMLSAAMAGVKDALERLAALDEMRAGLSVYNAEGGRETVSRGRNAMERKA